MYSTTRIHRREFKLLNLERTPCPYGLWACISYRDNMTADGYAMTVTFGNTKKEAKERAKRRGY